MEEVYKSMPIDKAHGADLVSSKIIKAKFEIITCECEQYMQSTSTVR